MGSTGSRCRTWGWQVVRQVSSCAGDPLQSPTTRRHRQTRYIRVMPPRRARGYGGRHGRADTVSPKTGFSRGGSADVGGDAMCHPEAQVTSATPKRFCEFALNIPARQTNIPKLTTVELGKGLPFPDPPPPRSHQTTEPTGQPCRTIGRKSRINSMKSNNVRCDDIHDTSKQTIGIALQMGRSTESDKRSFIRVLMT